MALRPEVPRASSQSGSGADPKATAEKLLEAANDGAKSLKGLFFWYVGALTYAVISVAGVADEQLLKQTPLTLPILNVDIPLVEYFAVLPLVVVLVHLELLVQFALLSNKINDFRVNLRQVHGEEASDFRLRLENFMLSHMLAGGHRSILHGLLFLLIYCALVILPLFTLLMIQAQFLAYHSEAMMWWHRILVLMDGLALLYFWPNLFHREDMSAQAWLRLMVLRVLPRTFLLLTLLLGIYVLLALSDWALVDALVVTGLVLLVCLVLSTSGPLPRPAERLSNVASLHIARVVLPLLLLAGVVGGTLWIGRNAIGPGLGGGRAPSLALAGAGAVLLLLVLCRWRNGLRAVVVPKTLWHEARRGHRFAKRHDAPGMAVFGVQCLSALVISSFVLSIPTGTETKVALVEICALPAHETPRLTRFWQWLLVPAIPAESSIFWRNPFPSPFTTPASNCASTWGERISGDVIDGKASPSALLLAGVGKRRVLVLDEKIMANHELSPDQRQKLRAGDPAARGGIEPLDLRGRNLSGIQLDDAVVPRLKIDHGTKLEGASLEHAQLQGATFAEVDLRNMPMNRARLQGATMTFADLSSSALEGAELQGAVLRSATLKSSELEIAALQGVTATEAHFEGATLAYADLTGSNFEKAYLGGAWLLDTNLQGASFAGADLAGAWIQNALMNGADLAEAKLDFAVIADPIVGRLVDPHKELMPNEDFGDDYANWRDAFLQHVKAAQGTRWPEPAAKCFLILDNDIASSLLPNCVFVMRNADSSTAMSSSPDIEFWTKFWTAQTGTTCLLQPDSEKVRRRVDRIIDAVLKLSHPIATQPEMIEAATSALVRDRCRHHWTRQMIEDRYEAAAAEIESEKESGVLTTEQKATELFYSQWLEALDTTTPEASPKN